MAYLERDGEPRSAGWRDLIMSLAVVSALAAGLLLSACGSNLPEMAQMIKEATLGRPASSDENLVNKGYREIEAGNYAYAEIYLDSALSINPSNPLALLNMAVVYEKTGRESEARALYSALIRRNPSDASGAVLTEENSGLSIAEAARENLAVCQWRSKKGPPRRCKKGPLGGCGLVPVVHGRAPRATRRALNRLTRRRAREGPVGPRGQAWAGWSVQLAVGV